MLRNPFQYLQHVTPDKFAGRWPLVHSIAQDLSLEQGDSHAIIAGHRSGKTSLLVALAHELQQMKNRQPGQYIGVPIYIDLKATTFDSAEAVFAYILNRVHRQLSSVTRNFVEDLWTSRLRQSARWFELRANEPKISQADFEDGLNYVLDLLYTPVAPIRLILLLDQADLFMDQPWTNTLYNAARALICSSDLSTQFRLVLSGSQRLLAPQTAFGSSLCDVLHLHYLHAFNPEQMADLTQRAPGLSPATADAIAHQSGGHPFLAQYLLYRLWERVDAEDLSSADPTLVSHLVSDFLYKRGFELDGWAQEVGVIGLQVYRILMNQPEWLSINEIIDAVDAPAPAIQRALLSLYCHGVVHQSEGWTEYRYTGELFKRWFNTCSLGIPASATTNNPWAEMSRQGYPINLQIHTGGGSYIAGDVHTNAGNFVGRDSSA